MPTSTSKRSFKTAVYEEISRVGKAVASPKRLELLDVLCQGPRTVEALGREIDQSTANTSHHLQILRTARLVEAEKHGLFVTYRLASEEVCAFYGMLRRLAESQLSEISRVTRTFLEERGALETVDRETLVGRVRRGEVVVIDVRPEEEYEAGHIPGAISIPVAQLEARLAELPADQEIVAYCRGPYCVMSIEAVVLLRDRGYQAVRLEDGPPDWKARGFEVVHGGGVS